MTYKELLDLFLTLPPFTVVLNAPVHPHKHQGSAGGLALVQPTPTIWSQRPSSTVGDVIKVLMQQVSFDFALEDRVFLVESMHQAGRETKGLLLMPDGIRLVSE